MLLQLDIIWLFCIIVVIIWFDFVLCRNELDQQCKFICPTSIYNIQLGSSSGFYFRLILHYTITAVFYFQIICFLQNILVVMTSIRHFWKLIFVFWWTLYIKQIGSPSRCIISSLQHYYQVEVLYILANIDLLLVINSFVWKIRTLKILDKSLWDCNAE